MFHSLNLHCVSKQITQFSCFVQICNKNFYLFPMGNKLKVMNLTTATPAPSPVGSARSTLPLANLLLLQKTLKSFQ